MLKQVPVRLVRWRDVIDHDQRVMLLDELPEIDMPVAQLEGQRGHDHESRLLDRQPEHVDDVRRGVDDRNYRQSFAHDPIVAPAHTRAAPTGTLRSTKIRISYGC